MSVTTWTPTALQREACAYAGSGWRAVEALHKNATIALARGNLDDQATLESILEEVKPRVPVNARGLHWLLMTPFRYPPSQGGSRFRQEGDPGVFYGAEEVKTACAEAGYWRWRFWMDSEGLGQQAKSLQMTLFKFYSKTERSLDLTLPPLAQDGALWRHPSNYSHTQQLAAQARDADIEQIRYESVRYPGGVCLAILTPEVFKRKDGFRGQQQSWTLHIQPPLNLTWQKDLTGEGFSLTF